MKPFYHGDALEIWHGDCRAVLKYLDFLDTYQVDSIVTDPPYELGFMGKKWDGTGIAYDVNVWRAAFKILKPGGYLLAFGGSRTYHRLACAIEDAGFEIRDDIDFWYDANPIFADFYDSLSDEQKYSLHQSAGASHLSWIYGSGFPKSLDVSKAIDAAAGVEREVVGSHTKPVLEKGRGHGRDTQGHVINKGVFSSTGLFHEVSVTAATTDAAKQWDGWGTALKPAHEPIVMARKPLEGTVAANVLKWGTGGLNIDGCRIGTEDTRYSTSGAVEGSGWGTKGGAIAGSVLGRFPANVIHDGSDEVLAGFPDSKSPTAYIRFSGSDSKEVYGEYASRDGSANASYGDSGSSARFFYCAKASKEDREQGLEDLAIRSAGEVTDRKDGSDGLNSPRAGAGRMGGSRNNHPTVKPTELMRYLVRLVTPPGGTVLDLFAGSGSTGKACALEQMKAILIEKELEYCELSVRRARLRQQLIVF